MSNNNSGYKDAEKSVTKEPSLIGKEPPADYFRVDGKTNEEKTKEETSKHDKGSDGKKEPSPLLPSVPGTEGVDALPYYHGLVPREDMKELLTGRGTYLIRTTELNIGEARTYCLSVIWDSEIRHFPLKPMPDSGHFNLGGSKPFPTILDMLKYFISTGEKFSPHEIRLNKPVLRQDWELLHANVRLTAKLGNGAFGEVFSGKLEIAERKWIEVAVKVMKCGIINKEQIEATMAEARRLRHLEHPNIVRCHGVAADIEPIYIIMELVKGGSLDKYLTENADNIQLDERILMLRDISSAVLYLHDENVLHCDIASRNCLFGGGVTKVSDFGLSRKADNGAIAQNERMPVRWMAPEAYATHSFSKETDVWALGVLFWEIFTNAAEPYTGWTGQQVRDQVTYHKYHLPMPEGTPEDLAELVKRMFAFEPQKRVAMKTIMKEVEKLVKQYSKERIKAKEAGGGNSKKKTGGKDKKAAKAEKTVDAPRTSVEKVKEKADDEKGLKTAAVMLIAEKKKPDAKATQRKKHDKEGDKTAEKAEKKAPKEKTVHKERTVEKKEKTVDKVPIVEKKAPKEKTVDKERTVEKKAPKQKTEDKKEEPAEPKTPPAAAQPSDKKSRKKGRGKKIKTVGDESVEFIEAAAANRTSTKRGKKSTKAKERTVEKTVDKTMDVSVDEGGEQKKTVDDGDAKKKTKETGLKKNKKHK